MSRAQQNICLSREKIKHQCKITKLIAYRNFNFGEGLDVLHDSWLQHNVVIVRALDIETRVGLHSGIDAEHRIDAHKRGEDLDVRAEVAVESTLVSEKHKLWESIKHGSGQFDKE